MNIQTDNIDRLLQNSGVTVPSEIPIDQLKIILRKIISFDGILVYDRKIPRELIEKIEVVSEKLKAVPAIKNQDDADKVNKILKEGKVLIKQIEDAGLEMRRPINEISDAIMEAQKSSIAGLKAMADVINKNLVAFAKEQEAKRIQEEARIKKESEEKAARELERVTKIRTTINKLHQSILAAIQEATTIEVCDEKINKLTNLKFDSAIYQESIEEVENLRISLKEKFLEKRAALVIAQQNLLSDGEDVETAIKEMQQKEAQQNEQIRKENEAKIEQERISALQNAQIEQEFLLFQTKGAKSVSKVWIHSLIDISLVPRAYLMLDEKKVKEAIKEGNYFIPGLKIEQEIRNVSR